MSFILKQTQPQSRLPRRKLRLHAFQAGYLAHFKVSGVKNQHQPARANLLTAPTL